MAYALVKNDNGSLLMICRERGLWWRVTCASDSEREARVRAAGVTLDARQTGFVATGQYGDESRAWLRACERAGVEPRFAWTGVINSLGDHGAVMAPMTPRSITPTVAAYEVVVADLIAASVDIVGIIGARVFDGHVNSPYYDTGAYVEFAFSTERERDAARDTLRDAGFPTAFMFGSSERWDERTARFQILRCKAVVWNYVKREREYHALWPCLRAAAKRVGLGVFGQPPKDPTPDLSRGLVAGPAYLVNGRGTCLDYVVEPRRVRVVGGTRRRRNARRRVNG